VLEHIFGVSSRIIHCRSSKEIQFEEILKHFSVQKSPIMMGGDQDAASKAIHLVTPGHSCNNLGHYWSQRANERPKAATDFGSSQVWEK